MESLSKSASIEEISSAVEKLKAIQTGKIELHNQTMTITHISERPAT